MAQQRKRRSFFQGFEQGWRDVGQAPWWLIGLLLWLGLLLASLMLGGCSYAPQEWLGRQLSGLDCRAQSLDAQGRCVPAK
jgi:hypothetical protein